MEADEPSAPRPHLYLIHSVSHREEKKASGNAGFFEAVLPFFKKSTFRLHLSTSAPAKTPRKKQNALVYTGCTTFFRTMSRAGRIDRYFRQKRQAQGLLPYAPPCVFRRTIIAAMKLSENIELLHGDCIDLLPKIPDGSIDAIITDPPYGTTKCAWDIQIPFDSLWKEYKRILKQSGVIILFGNEPFTSDLICSNKKMFREKLTWQKHKPSNMGNAKRMHLKYSEDIVVFSYGKNIYTPQMQPRISDRVRQAQRGKSKQWRTNGNNSREVCFATQYAPRDWSSFDADYKYPSNIITFPGVVSNSHEKVNHPTQKPVALLEYLIRTYTEEQHIILDNCMGSGTTGVACINTGRKFIGIELDDGYFDIAKKRIATALQKKGEQKG